MADENEQQSACEAGRDEQHCKCRQRRAAAEAAAANASAAQQPAAHHCTCKHDGAEEAGDEQPKHCACKHDAEGHAISTEPHLGYVADLASLIEIQQESTVSRVVMREDGLRVVLFGFEQNQALDNRFFRKIESNVAGGKLTYRRVVDDGLLEAILQTVGGRFGRLPKAAGPAAVPETQGE